MRTNKNFTLRHNRISSEDMKEFLKCYGGGNRRNRKESERFKRYFHADILASNRANLDLVWLSSNSYRDPDMLPPHDVLAAEVIALLKDAVNEFEAAVAVVAKGAKRAKKA